MHCCFYHLLHFLSSLNILILPYSSLQPPLFSFFPAHHLCPFIPPHLLLLPPLYPVVIFQARKDTHSLREGSGAHRTCSTPFFHNPCAHVPIGVNPKRSAYASKPRNPHLHIAFSVPGHGGGGGEVSPFPAQLRDPSLAKARFVSKVCTLAPV